MSLWRYLFHNTCIIFSKTVISVLSLSVLLLFLTSSHQPLTCLFFLFLWCFFVQSLALERYRFYIWHELFWGHNLNILNFGCVLFFRLLIQYNLIQLEIRHFLRLAGWALEVLLDERLRVFFHNLILHNDLLRLLMAHLRGRDWLRFLLSFKDLVRLRFLHERRPLFETRVWNLLRWRGHGSCHVHLHHIILKEVLRFQRGWLFVIELRVHVVKLSLKLLTRGGCHTDVFTRGLAERLFQNLRGMAWRCYQRIPSWAILWPRFLAFGWEPLLRRWGNFVSLNELIQNVLQTVFTFDHVNDKSSLEVFVVLRYVVSIFS